MLIIITWTSHPRHTAGIINVKYVVIDRWFVSQIVGKGSIFIDDPSPTDFPIGTSVRTIGPED